MFQGSIPKALCCPLRDSSDLNDLRISVDSWENNDQETTGEPSGHSRASSCVGQKYLLGHGPEPSGDLDPLGQKNPSKHLCGVEKFFTIGI